MADEFLKVGMVWTFEDVTFMTSGAIQADNFISHLPSVGSLGENHAPPATKILSDLLT